ncbi:MAG TPA: tRNA (adenosine(37)-N6)-threonylcarbamoyltransferase complex dimerization subunit type 1 TsaB [Anaerolineaceae bacterium]|nr:tRNA (adenosine(37)-N6)-threonylcarbamoyltransferase complex dimerization subunit type 1 TsaB [Anaerolineaceae bacterium]
MLLVVDTSTQSVGLGLFDGTEIIGEMVWQTHSHHSVELAPAVNSLLKRCKVPSSSLTALGIALGPGSFTSLRIGLAFVKGFALTLHLPVIGIPTLDIVAAAITPQNDYPLAAILRAGRSRLAVGWYDSEDTRWRSRGEAEVMGFETLSGMFRQPTLVCGELDPDQRAALARKKKNVILASPALSVRRPAYLAELVWERWQAGQADDVVSLAPIYLHVKDPIPSP